jgi:hypothetical protein
VTPAIEEDLRQNIEKIASIPDESREVIFKAALASIRRGRDLASLCSALRGELPKLTRHEAGEIARSFHNKATALITRARQIESGIERAKWLYSGAPCGVEDEHHKAANGQIYPVKEGLLINGKRSWPGCEDGCKCVSRAIVRGFG